MPMSQLPDEMQVIRAPEPGDADVLQIHRLPLPRIGADDDRSENLRA